MNHPPAIDTLKIAVSARPVGRDTDTEKADSHAIVLGFLEAAYPADEAQEESACFGRGGAAEPGRSHRRSPRAAVM